MLTSLFAWSDVSSGGRLEDIQSNPAAIAKRDRDEYRGLFLSFDYSDVYSEPIFSNLSKYSYVQSPSSVFSIGFVGGNISFSADLGFFLNNKTYDSAGYTYFDFNNTTRFNLSTAWEYKRFAIGASVTGGNLSQNLNRKIENGFDIIGNAFFGNYEVRSDKADLQAGIGGLFSDGPYNIGINFEKILYVQKNEFTVNSDIILQNLTMGASVSFSKFNKNGDLRFLKPRFFFEIAKFTSSATKNSIGINTVFQLLPKKEINATFVFVALSDGFYNFLKSYDQYFLVELSYRTGRMLYGVKLANKNRNANVSLFLRYIR